MSIEEQAFWPYVVIDEEGLAVGVKDDAPEEMKAAYHQWLAEYDAALQEGFKL